jgi:hypothetical protein
LASFLTTESTEDTEVGKEEGVRIGELTLSYLRSGSVTSVPSVVKKLFSPPLRLCGLCALCGEKALPSSYRVSIS